MKHLFEMKDPAPLYLGVDEAPVALNEVYEFLASELGLPPPRTSTDPDERSRGPQKVVSGELLRRSGYQYKFPTYREGYRAILRSTS